MHQRNKGRDLGWGRRFIAPGDSCSFKPFSMGEGAAGQPQVSGVATSAGQNPAPSPAPARREAPEAPEDGGKWVGERVQPAWLEVVGMHRRAGETVCVCLTVDTWLNICRTFQSPTGVYIHMCGFDCECTQVC